MRLTFLLLAAAVLLVSACSDGVDAKERRAAEVVNAQLADEAVRSYLKPANLLNLDEHKTDCLIGEGSATGVEPMPAKCEWSTGTEGNFTTVSFIEKWKCSDYNERAGRDDFCRSSEGKHEWRWAIDEAEVVYFLEDQGDAVAESFYLE